MDLPSGGRRTSHASYAHAGHLFLSRQEQLLVEVFLVDSGADISLAPRHLCELLGVDWESGVPINLSGISPKPECTVPARILDVELLVPDIEVALNIPICFADGNSSLILGRQGFFDAFRVTFDKQRLETVFELIG